jgi:hypothetical protein
MRLNNRVSVNQRKSAVSTVQLLSGIQSDLTERGDRSEAHLANCFMLTTYIRGFTLTPLFRSDRLNSYHSTTNNREMSLKRLNDALFVKSLFGQVGWV